MCTARELNEEHAEITSQFTHTGERGRGGGGGLVGYSREWQGISRKTLSQSLGDLRFWANLPGIYPRDLQIVWLHDGQR